MGENSHERHHLVPEDYRAGIRWYHLDIAKWFIRLCSAVGLASSLRSLPEQSDAVNLTVQQRRERIDAHEKELGIARPYLDRDPPHVAPLDGAEYAAKRGRVIAQKPGMQTKTHARVAGRKHRGHA